MERDYYEVLGVDRGASPDELKKSYRRLARELHPDRNPGDGDAEARFKEVARAYEVLSDPERRARYDRFGHAAEGGGGAGGDPFGAGFGDIFDAFFGQSGFGGRGPSGPAAGPDLQATVRLSFTDAVLGTATDVEVRTAVACETCEATGAKPGTRPVTCPQCNGSGQIQRVRQSLLGQMVTASPCDRCSGSGRWIEHTCATCSGEGRVVTDKTYTVDVPAGVDTGSTLRLSGRGAAGPRGGPHGDLYVRIAVADHAYLTRDGDDLVHDLEIPMTQAALGAELDYETLYGTEELRIRPGAQTGEIHRLRGHGVPRLQGRGRGDLLVRLRVETPTDLDSEQRELVRRLAELRGDEVADDGKGWFGRLRSAFNT